MTLLSVTSLSASLGGVKVLDRVSLKIARGEFVGLIGPNGAGKSTLLRAAIGLLPATGQIEIGGRYVSALTAVERARLVSYLPQEREVAWAVPVEMLVSLGRAPHRPRFGPLSGADHAAVEEAMRRMDVVRFRNRAATELSGGELARVLIARVLAQDAPLLFADEPTVGLDPAHQIGLMRTFAGLAADGRAVVASLHDLALAARWCSRLILLHNGGILADDAPETALSDHHVRRAYGITVLSKRIDGHWILQPLDVTDDNAGAQQ